jgi:hypothetical protein
VTHAATPDFEQNLVDFGSARFTQLRQGQRQVLAAYAEHHLDTADLAIEMPTGEGKTLLALLIADHALARGWSVAYLTGTRQLAERVEEEAEALGLEVVRFAAGDYGGAKLDDYHQAQSVGVMNYWVYFNSSPVPRPADLVIFDDAHLAEQPLSGLQTLRIPDKHGPARELYRTICELVVAHTDAYPGLRAMLDGTARPGTPPELLSFKDWDAIADPTRNAIAASPLVTDRDLKDEMRYVWPTVRDHLTQCGVLIGPSAIEIRPYHPPTALNPQYSRAKQRIYLSATLGSMDDLQRRLGGGGPVTRLTTAEPLPPGATGRTIAGAQPRRGARSRPERARLGAQPGPGCGRTSRLVVRQPRRGRRPPGDPHRLRAAGLPSSSRRRLDGRHLEPSRKRASDYRWPPRRSSSARR